jgi:hypothetical protein
MAAPGDQGTRETGGQRLTSCILHTCIKKSTCFAENREDWQKGHKWGSVSACWRRGEGAVGRKTRCSEDIIALECLPAPVLSRSVRLASARTRNYRTQARPGTGFWISLGEATLTARLRTGAGAVKQLAASWARRVFRPTGPFAPSPCRPYASSGIRDAWA